jgi:hypothetical protein
MAEESASVMFKVTGVLPGNRVAGVLDMSIGVAWKVAPSLFREMA